MDVQCVGIRGDQLAEMEYDSHDYVFTSVFKHLKVRIVFSVLFISTEGSRFILCQCLHWIHSATRSLCTTTVKICFSSQLRDHVRAKRVLFHSRSGQLHWLKLKRIPVSSDTDDTQTPSHGG